MQVSRRPFINKEILRAREEERKHIARDLHDRVIQTLAGLSYQVAALRDQPELQVEEQLLCMQHDLRQLIEEIRCICSDLRPPILDTRGLVAAIRAAAEHARDHGK